MGRVTDNRDMAKLSIVITHPTGGNDLGHRVNLRIEDKASGILLIDAELDAEQFAQLLATRSVSVDAKVPNAAHRGRLFKRHEHKQVLVPVDLGHKSEYASNPGPIDDWAESIRVRDGWDVVTVVTGSQKFYAWFERWVEFSEEGLT